MTTVNSISGEMLRDYIEKLEAINADKQQLSEQAKAIMADAKAKGFVPEGIKHVVKLRAMTPSELSEADMLIDTYRNAMGMGGELPLFKHVGMMGVDIAKRDEVIEALKQLVPPNGSIQVETTDGKPVRLLRDKDGNVTVQEIFIKPQDEPAAGGPRRATPPPPRGDVPACNEDEAEALGSAAYAENMPIIKNPFPFGDPRRQRWDRGWRAASGGDGMGPQDKGDK